MYKINTSCENKNSNKIKYENNYQNMIHNNMINNNMINNNMINNNMINNNIINEDMKKMHLLPPHCPMTPKSYTDFFNDNTDNTDNTYSNQKLYGSKPYKSETVKHPKEGYKHTIETQQFYSDFKKDALEYTSKNYEFIDNNLHNNNYNSNNYYNSNNNNNENIKIYKETKPHSDFAKPMAINGSNKVADLFDNCMNKKTFEYKRYSTISPHHKQWIDNPLFTEDISQETLQFKNNYIESREEENMNLYSSIFEDMYAMSYNKTEFTSSAIVKKIENKLKQNNLENDNITKIKATKAIKLNKLLSDREKLRQSNNNIK
jgi:hypothetical protein